MHSAFHEVYSTFKYNLFQWMYFETALQRQWLKYRLNQTLVPKTLCYLGKLCFKVAWYTLHHKSLSLSKHLTPWHTLLLSTPCSLEHFLSGKLSPWNNLLHVILYFLEYFPLSGPSCKVSRGAMCSRVLSKNTAD